MEGTTLHAGILAHCFEMLLVLFYLFYELTIKDLACTFRASCYSARLSWALVSIWVSPVVQNKNGGIRVGKRVGYLATTFTLKEQEGRKDMFYLTTHSTHFIYGYMASYIW